MLQSAASKISLVDIPESFAKDTEAPLTECALKIEVSIHALSMTVLNQWAIVEVVTGL